jgi:hypothetical protein
MRSRKGCWTCKARHYKCDKTRPRCKSCVARGLECQGYEVRLRWSETLVPRKSATDKKRSISGSTIKDSSLGDCDPGKAWSPTTSSLSLHMLTASTDAADVSSYSILAPYMTMQATLLLKSFSRVCFVHPRLIRT